MPTALTRWDPMNELSSMRNVMDRLFDQSFGRLPSLRSGEDFGATNLGLDVYETNDHYVVKAAIPGVDPSQVDISVEDDVLTIKGEFEQKDEKEENNYLRRELRYGSFERMLRLPPTVDAEHAEATFDHGMLKLEIPKKPEARAKSFKITPKGVVDGQGGNGHKA
ncbi:MAG: Hsp20/alpha crystallin family protein [Chloroflexi bacterium]|nr:Hsp20/alpha crystallin family protein [Chloroflexota bacterium]